MKRIYSVLVENRSGVLGKVAGLFARRCFNIDSLTVGETDNPDVSCMTIVSSGDQRTIEQIEKQLNKKIDVIKVKTFPEEKRNLIYIYLESMETTYFNKDEGGALEVNIIPELYELAQKGKYTAFSWK